MERAVVIGAPSPFDASFGRPNLLGSQEVNILHLADLLQVHDHDEDEDDAAEAVGDETSVPAASEARPDRRHALPAPRAGTELRVVEVLDQDTAAHGLSCLGHSALGTDLVYLHLALPGYGLKDIGILSGYVHIQKLDLSHNKIKDNNISEIIGLEECSSLAYLSLAHNRIRRLDGLGSLPLRYLCLRGNHLRKITGLEKLWKLEKVDLSGNKIRSLKGLEGHYRLQELDMEGNQITELAEVKYIKDLSLLRVLNLLRNPVQESPGHRIAAVFQLQTLVDLDLRRVTVEEKVAAVNRFNPSPEMVAARDHVIQVVYSTLQPQRVLDSTLPSLDTPYPMVVLTGPRASGKRELNHRICREFCDFLGYGVSHTTRSPYPGEQDGKDYHFVTKETFERLVCDGKFLQTEKYDGHSYGLSIDDVEDLARDGLACAVHMELEGARSLKRTYFEPRYLLVVPLDRKRHERRLLKRGLYDKSQMEASLAGLDACLAVNQDMPGFFDAVIVSDDLEVAYSKLRELMCQYMGLEPPKSGAESAHQDAGHVVPPRLCSTGDRPTSATLSRLTWTKAPSPQPRENMQYLSRLQSKMQPQLTPLEEASLLVRQQAARDAVTGKALSANSKLLGSGPKSAPATLLAANTGSRSANHTDGANTGKRPLGSQVSLGSTELSLARALSDGVSDEWTASLSGRGEGDLDAADEDGEDDDDCGDGDGLTLQRGGDGQVESLDVRALSRSDRSLTESEAGPLAPRPRPSEVVEALRAPREPEAPPSPKPVLPPIPAGRVKEGGNASPQ
uniref:Leucine-rich repeat and guanylate kinase domain-containing protein isoform X2 n=1 Tax=Petromyzon marinus TaxID=7757 RepID=A0AAJ7U4W1_PETMA|nr:leucine-rich repeat and guanylate kinase domain-containing protein isoform X2 [Petromyzon marinus]